MKSLHKITLEAPSHLLVVIPKCKLIQFFLSLALLGSLRSYAGTSQKWEDLPQAVRATILAHGGTAKGRVDLESGKMNGLAIYEAAGKDKKGKEGDLVITADGKLQTTKDDDAAERPKEAIEDARKALANLKFSHPTEINNPFLPMATLKKDVLEGKEGQMPVRIERIARPDVQRKFKYGKQTIESLAVED